VGRSPAACRCRPWAGKPGPQPECRAVSPGLKLKQHEFRILVQGPVRGEQALKELALLALADGSSAALTDLRADLRETARGLAALHQSGARYGRVATLAGELDEVREVVNRLSHTLPDVAAAATPLLHSLELLDAAVPADPVVSAHHDFRPAQVLINNGRVGFIDFGGAGMAEPALDLGRFHAKLRDIWVCTPAPGGRPLAGMALAERLATADELCEHFLAAYQDHARVTPARVVLREAVDLLTALLHAWTKVRLRRVGPRLAVLLDRLRSARLDTVP
jgi:aminoglycoside phosphotransferase (APT) family kinase protein